MSHIDAVFLRRQLSSLASTPVVLAAPDVVLPSPSVEMAFTARPAAVLVGLLLARPQPTVLFTLRRRDLRVHGGQISFPGGRLDPEETELAAALREAEEEVGLSPQTVELVGWLPSRLTLTNFRISPLVAFIEPPPVWRPSPTEVAEVFELPLAAFYQSPEVRERRLVDGSVRCFYHYQVEGREIWGATAAILKSLIEVIKAHEPA